MVAYCLAMVEEKISASPIVYKRYVDDVFALFPSKTTAKRFLNEINTIHRSIKFTMEEENCKSLCLFDVKVERKERSFITSWHLKETNTGVYIPLNAYSPLSYKKQQLKD